tara:strand:+ start:1651 stop:2055 length:405 start_codon:yes stop_codon:yes gene_type:complete
MPTQEDLYLENTVSKNRQRETREKREAAKGIKDRRKELLQGATSSSEKRKIKAAADAALEQAGANFNKEYEPSENKQDYESDIQQRGTDQFTAPEATPETPQAGGLPSGFAEETLDVVNNDNTAGQRVFLTKAV